MISPKIDSRYKYDVEAGLSSPGRYARRFLARRARWILGVLVAAGVVLFLSDHGSAPGKLAGPLVDGERLAEDGVVSEGLEDIWEEEQVGESGKEGGKGWNWGFGLPFHRPGLTPTPTTTEDGGESGQGGGGDEGTDVRLPIDDYIAPMHPDLSLLPPPSSLFSEVDLATFLRPPEIDPFPEERLREIFSEPPEEVVTQNGWIMPEDAYSRIWVKPEEWDEPKGEMRRVQWEGFARGREGWENAEQRKVREERREAVKRGFVWAWQAYKTHAWGRSHLTSSLSR